MSSSRELTIAELDRDRSSRVARIQFGPKSILTPSFAPLIHTTSDLETLIQVRASNPTQHLGIFVVRSFDSHAVLPTRSKTLQMDMSGRVVTDRTSLFLENTAFVIDPATEYLYYDALMSKFLTEKSTPETIRDYVRQVLKQKRVSNGQSFSDKSKFHSDFWDRIAGDSAVRNRLLREIFQDAMHLGGDFLIPPVPIVLNDRLLDISIKLNDVSKEIALALGRKECASYFLLPGGAVRNARLLEKVKEYILYSSTRLNVIKLKYFDITAPGMIEHRENYRELLLDLAYFSKTLKNRCFMVLENYYQCFPSAVVGFDIVSSSITGYDGEHGHSKHPSYGKWIDPRLMVPVDFDNVKRIFHNNGDMLPCHHVICRGVKDIDHISPSEWNSIRRQHCPQYYADLMMQVARAVRDRNMELAREKLSNSPLTALKSLITNVQ